jgi:basic amino acid/polyamine antiporter, APA family
MPTATPTARQRDDQLVRAIGAPTLTANIVNLTIGAGIFVLPAFVAGDLGPAAPVAYVVCAVLMGLIVSCFAAAGSRVSLTGGLYAYIEVAFGPFIGFLAGVLFWLMASFAVASVGSAFAGSMGALLPAVDGTIGRALLIAALFTSLAMVNVRGVRTGAGLIRIVTVAKLLPLAVFVLAGIWFVDPRALTWPDVPGVSAIGQTCIILIFAFAGVEIALVPTGEVVNPTRTVPISVFTALAVTTTFYLLIQTTAQGLLASSLSTFATAPLAEAASRVLGGFGRALMLLGATVSMFGYASGDMLGTPRLIYAFGRDGLLPEPFARIHAERRTPYVAIAFHAIVVALLAISSSFAQLAILANVSALTLYGTCVAASIELQRRDVRDAASGGTPLRLPGGPTIPALAIVVIVWLLAHATRREFGIEATVLGIATAFYFSRSRGALG